MQKLANNPALTFDGTIVYKRYPDSNAAFEFEKSRRVWKVVGQVANCQTPRPLRLSECDNQIEFAYLPASGSLAGMYVQYLQGKTGQREFLALIDEAARLLASLHAHLDLPTRSSHEIPALFHEAAAFAGIRFPSESLHSSPQAFLHCDYGFANIACLFDAATDERQLVVYDPSPNNHSTFAPDQYGSIYLDIGCFFASLNGRFPLRHYLFSRWSRMQDAKQRFIDAYAHASGIEIRLELAEAVGYATAYASLTKWRGPGLRRVVVMKLLYNRFKRNTQWMHLLRART